MGGHPGPHTDLCVRYDFAADAWEEFTSLPEPRGGGGLIYTGAAQNSLLYAAGAERPRPGSIIDYQHTWMYSLDTYPDGEWVEKEDIPYLSNHISYGASKRDR